jgi:glycosyltransferase involved in cell wall biosynthesis
MTRVLMVADGLWNGGAERQLALLTSSLPEPWSASVLSMEDGPYRPVLEALGVETRLAPRHYRFDATPALRMWRAAADIRPDIVHSWGWMSTLAMLPYCRTHGIALLDGAIRRGDLPPRRATMYKLGLRLSDAAAANSRAGLTAFGVREGDRGRVVYNGFDPSRFAAVTTPILDHDAHATTTVVMAARMTCAKDWRLLLQAARQLSCDPGAWRMVAMGDGPDRAALVGEAADLIDSGVVEFPPSGLEALPAIAAAHIGVLLSDPIWHAEGCSNAIMEYMACGLPVVCTDSGGNPELVEHGVTGLLVPPRDAGALAAALRTLRDDPGHAREMGREGKRRLEARFTIGAMTEGFVSAYEYLLAARGKARP